MVPHQAVQEYETVGDCVAARAVQTPIQDRVRLPFPENVPRTRDLPSALHQRLHRQIHSRAPLIRPRLIHYWCFNLCDVSAFQPSVGGVFGVRIQICADGVSGFTIYLATPDGGKKEPDKKKETPKTPEASREMIDVPRGLRGRKLNDLFTHYTGIAGQVPDKVPGDFPTQQLPKLWELKKQKYGETPVVSLARQQLVGGYDQKNAQKMNWQQYRDSGQASIDSLRKSLDWNAVGKHFGLGGVDLKLLREFEAQINGSALLSYALTELMPGVDGPLNRDMLDFLLRVGGREYVERLPAVNDAKTSMGSYQFTEYALYDTGDEKR